MRNSKLFENPLRIRQGKKIILNKRPLRKRGFFFCSNENKIVRSGWLRKSGNLRHDRAGGDTFVTIFLAHFATYERRVFPAECSRSISVIEQRDVSQTSGGDRRRSTILPRAPFRTDLTPPAVSVENGYSARIDPVTKRTAAALRRLGWRCPPIFAPVRPERTHNGAFKTTQCRRLARTPPPPRSVWRLSVVRHSAVSGAKRRRRPRRHNGTAITIYHTHYNNRSGGGAAFYQCGPSPAAVSRDNTPGFRSRKRLTECTRAAAAVPEFPLGGAGTWRRLSMRQTITRLTPLTRHLHNKLTAAAAASFT